MGRKTRKQKSQLRHDAVDKTGHFFEWLQPRYTSRQFAPEQNRKRTNQPRRAHGTRKTL